MIDWVTLLSSIVVSSGAVIAAAKWLIGRAVDHRLEIRLADHQAKLDSELETLKAKMASEASAAQARLEASLRRADELVLGDEAAERSYRYDARKRLYGAVGPLRFQLLSAATQFLSRLEGLGEHGYGTKMGGYYGRSVLFRIARILALTELIERQVAYADFSADPATIVLLRFRQQILRAFSSGDVAMAHPGADWTRQKEHIFRDQLPMLAISMVVKEGDAERVVRFDEFQVVLAEGKGKYLQPLTTMVECIDATRTPIFWLRLLAIGQACEGLLQGESIADALDPPALDYGSLLRKSQDQFIQENQPGILEMLAGFRSKIALPRATVPAVA